MDSKSVCFINDSNPWFPVFSSLQKRGESALKGCILRMIKERISNVETVTPEIATEELLAIQDELALVSTGIKVYGNKGIGLNEYKQIVAWIFDPIQFSQTKNVATSFKISKENINALELALLNIPIGEFQEYCQEVIQKQNNQALQEEEGAKP